MKALASPKQLLQSPPTLTTLHKADEFSIHVTMVLDKALWMFQSKQGKGDIMLFSCIRESQVFTMEM